MVLNFLGSPQAIAGRALTCSREPARLFIFRIPISVNGVASGHYCFNPTAVKPSQWKQHWGKGVWLRSVSFSSTSSIMAAFPWTSFGDRKSYDSDKVARNTNCLSAKKKPSAQVQSCAAHRGKGQELVQINRALLLLRLSRDHQRRTIMKATLSGLDQAPK